MAYDNGSHAELDADGHENDQHGNRQNDLRDNNRHIEHEIDELFPAKLEFLEADAAQYADYDTDDGSDNGNDDRVDQCFPQIVVAEGKELSVPGGGEALPGIVPLGVVKGELDHHEYGNIEDRIDHRGIETAPETAALLALKLSVSASLHFTAPPCLQCWQSGNRGRSAAP